MDYERRELTQLALGCFWSHDFTDQDTAENVSWCPWWSWSLLLTSVHVAEGWLFLLGCATTDNVCLLLTLLN